MFLRKHITQSYMQISTSESVSIYLTGEIGFDIKERSATYGKRTKKGLGQTVKKERKAISARTAPL